MLVHVLVSRLLHVVVLTLLRVVVLRSVRVVLLRAVLLTVVGVMPLRSVHESSLSWPCTTLPSEQSTNGTAVSAPGVGPHGGDRDAAFRS